MFIDKLNHLSMHTHADCTCVHMSMFVYVLACAHTDTHAYVILHSFISLLSIYQYIQTFIHRACVILGVLHRLKKAEGQRIDISKLC